MADGLPAGTAVGPSELVVADLERVRAFYAGVLGLEAQPRADGTVALHAGGAPLLVLHGRPGAAAPPPRAAGLYHNAFLVPTRADLGRVLLRLAETPGVRLGAADHGVSEALYLEDPEGNGVEVYADRPRDAWPVPDGRLRMGTEPLDAQGLAALARPLGPAGLPEGTCLGHVHLRVTRLARSLDFYRRLGFATTQLWPPSAAFLAAGGYHHHLGLNTWESAGGQPLEPGRRGLLRFRLSLPAVADVREAAGRLGADVRDGELRVPDPDGVEVVVGVGAAAG
jgi:catechol 2,3-dioxygenase